MIEAGVVITEAGPIFWHLPAGRTGGYIPDSRKLWDVLLEHADAELLGFAHSHPGSGVPGPSHTDITTFAAIEAGLGRRLDWWITSSDHIIHLRWCGPGRLEYEAAVVEELDWASQLRNYSTGEQT
jgi:proteasome lid subunit RPN8/RPN11